jgi:type IV conjugative transfer system protein TraL
MKKLFPQYLSAPLQVLFWDSDELCIIVTFFTIAMIFGSVMWIFLILGPWAYSHMKKKYPRGFLQHILYFVGIVKINNYPSYFEDIFIE